MENITYRGKKSYLRKRKQGTQVKNKKDTIKIIAFVVILIYALITVIKQQKLLNSYESQTEALETQISEANEYQEELNQKKENVNSSEYIESIAREKLDMYLPNEKVYVDSEN